MESTEGQQLRHCPWVCQLITITLESSLSFNGEVDHEHSQNSTQPHSPYDLCHLFSVQLLSSVPTRSVHSTSFSSEVSQTPSFLSALLDASLLSMPHSDSDTLCWLAASSWFPPACSTFRLHVLHAIHSFWPFGVCCFVRPNFLCSSLSAVASHFFSHSLSLPSVPAPGILESPPINPLIFSVCKKTIYSLPHSLPNTI